MDGFLLLFALVAGAAWWQWTNKKLRNEVRAEANRPPPEEGARFAGTTVVKDAELFAPVGMRLGHWPEGPEGPEDQKPVIRYAGENHLITVGKPGSGKGATVIIPTLLEYPGSIIVMDPKGQNAAVTARRRRELGNTVHVINPYGLFTERLGAQPTGYNPLARIDAGSDSFVGDVRSLSQALIVTDSREAHWPDSARELVAAIIMQVCLTAPPERRNLAYVREILGQPMQPTSPNATGLLAAIDKMATSPFAPLAQKAAQFTDDTREMKSVVSTAQTQLAFLDDPAIAASVASPAGALSFAAMKRAPATVFIILPAQQMEAQGRWLRLLITSAIDELTEEPRPGDKRVLFILDEFAQLGRLQAIERALALVRGYGVQLWPFVQDLPQLKSIYDDRWESFLATAGVAQFFAPNDAMTAEFLSKRIGKRLRTRMSVSHGESGDARQSLSFNRSFSQSWEPLTPPWDLFGMRGDRQALMVEGVSEVMMAARQRYGDHPVLSKLADPDPYHLPPPTA